jgi:hypothetical protein
MRATPVLFRLALCLSSLTPLVSAWPEWLPERDSLIVRQDDSSEETSANSAEETGSSTNTDEATNTRESETSEPTADPTNSSDDNGDDDATTTGRDRNTAVPSTGSRSGSQSSEPTRTSFGVNDYPGGIQMLTPDTTAVATALYKIGDYVTLGWNYTSVKAKPTAVDVLVSCSVASETWTLTANMTYETEVSFIWDTKDQANAVESPLLTEMYTLIVKDSEAEVSDRPEPGYLGSVQSFTFGLYRPLEYTPLSEWECTACNAAVGGMDAQVVRLAIVMALVTICSFTWFVTGLGLQ